MRPTLPLPFRRVKSPKSASKAARAPRKSAARTGDTQPSERPKSSTSLTGSALKTIALTIGSRVGGVKSDVQRGIEETVEMAEKSPVRAGSRILSIDMGIRNLAYAFVRMEGTGSGKALTPVLEDWRRLDVTASVPGRDLDESTPQDMTVESRAIKEGEDPASSLPTETLAGTSTNTGASSDAATSTSFEPVALSRSAYHLVSSLLETHSPTHVLIERQRFRSGSQSAVLEWSLRVGVFEGILHAMFKGLIEERGLDVHVQSVDPGVVARFWGRLVEEAGMDDNGTDTSMRTRAEARRKGSKTVVDGQEVRNDQNGENGDHLDKTKPSSSAPKAKKKSSPANIKKLKIQITVKHLLPTASTPPSLKISPQIQSALLPSFLAKALPPSTPSSSTPKPPSTEKSAAALPQRKLKKIDDLADSLLSLLTWLEWQRVARYLLQTTSPKTETKTTTSSDSDARDPASRPTLTLTLTKETLEGVETLVEEVRRLIR